jgi:hypothetical protein
MHIGSISIEMIDVLIVTPDVVGGGDISLLLTTLAAFPDLNVVVWDGNAGTPTVADMQLYDVVFVGNDILWTSSAIDKIALSNNLADYVDAGGKILVGSFVWSYDDWGFGGGRFITEDYSPFEIATSDIWEPTTLGDFDPDHPVMAGITSVTDNYNHQDQVLSSTGTWVASWADGENFVGVSPNVVGLNQLYFYTADFGGQAGELLHNALLYLGAPPIMDIPWLSEMPTFGVIPSGWSTDVEVTFDSTGMGAGEYYGMLDLFSNDPVVPEYPMPAQLTVMVPEVHLDKTVGLTEATCQDTDIITVVPGTEVVYCYELINTGTYTMTTHDLVDDMLGVLLDDFVYVLAPGESVLITESAVINEYTLNTAYYTATTEAGGFDASAQNAAIVNVINPAIELEKTVGIDPNVCATTDSVQVLAGTDVTYCFKVTNTGDATLAVHDLVDSELGDLLTDFAYDLAPGASVYITETATIVADVENTATWTAWFDDVFFAEATDTASVDVIEAAIELVKTVGLNPEVCATTDVITVPVGTEVTYCFTVLNTGDITLTVHDLSDSALGDLFAVWQTWVLVCYSFLEMKPTRVW